MSRSNVCEVVRQRSGRIDVLVANAGGAVPAVLGIVPGDQQDSFAKMMAGVLPAGRLGEPDEVASAALLLASDTATHVNGTELFIDGAYTSV